jgi:serine/threonine protein kinase
MLSGTLGHYRIVRLIGRGGMGEVYLADDTLLGRQVALKILPPELSAGDRRERFDREARAVAALNHPNIVTLHSIDQAADTPFLTMEFVDGKGLGELIPATGLPLDRLRKIAIPLADAVGAAHQRGILHRDLRPANVMVTGDGLSPPAMTPRSTPRIPPMTGGRRSRPTAGQSRSSRTGRMVNGSG